MPRVGVLAEGSGRELAVRGTRGVHLGTGGYGVNEALKRLDAAVQLAVNGGSLTVSGATITSRAVADAIQSLADAVSAHRGELLP